MARCDLPDPQHAYLAALEKRAEEVLTEEEFGYAAECEPESHVFYGDHWDHGYDDPEEYHEIVMHIGGRDLDEKIRHWESAIAAAGTDSFYREFRPRGMCAEQRAEMRVGA